MSKKTPLTRVIFSPLLQLGAQPTTQFHAVLYMGENPIQVLIYVVVLAVYVLHLYRTEYRKRGHTAELDTNLPGATACAESVYAYAVIEALAILALETGGEIALGIVAEQSQVYAYSVFAALAAGVIEESDLSRLPSGGQSWPPAIVGWMLCDVTALCADSCPSVEF